MSISTFVGCVTGSVPWLHFVVLCVWSLAGGLLVALGNRGGAVGTQSIIAFVVFGRFSQPAGPALGLALLVLVGGFAQVLFQSVARWPPPLQVAARTRPPRPTGPCRAWPTATAESSTLPAATALDEAQETLSSPMLFGDPAVLTLRSLVNEGQRMRVGLTAIHSLVRRRQADADGGPDPPARGAERILALTAEGLDLAARAIEGDRAAAGSFPRTWSRLSSDTAEHALTPDASGMALSRRLAAPGGAAPRDRGRWR